MRKPLNVCLVAPLPPQSEGNNHSCGGIGHWTKIVLKYAESRDDVKLHVIDTTPKWRGIHNFSLWKRSLSGCFNLCSYIFHLFKRLSASKLDVVHMTTSGSLGVVRDLIVIFATKLFKVPLIYHIRFGRVPNLALRGGVEWGLISYAMKLASTVVAIDKSTYDAVKRHLSHVDVELVPNCINFASLPKVETLISTKQIFLFAGWVIPAKGVEELLAAWSRAQRTGWELQIVGPVDPAYQAELTERFHVSNVHFLGEKPHSETLLLISGCDVFVLPSYSEGFPNAVLEAMACGKPIIATTVGAIPEMLSEGAGRLVAVKDEYSLGTAMLELMDDQALRVAMGKKGRKRAFDNYSIETSFNRYIAIWERAASGEVGVA